MRRLVVEPMLPCDEAAAWATAEELAAVRDFAPGRAREYLAWRAVVRRELGRGVRIGYTAAGAPELPGLPLCLSVSHGAGQVAVAIADRPCGVDIERTDRNFARIEPRYLTPAERQLSGHPLFPAIAWCAKEALYKYAGTPCDLLGDLRLEAVEFTRTTPPAGRLTARCKGAPGPLTVDFYAESAFAVACVFG